MIDRAWIGHTFPPREVDVEAGRLRQFAKATGETRPEYLQRDAALKAGWSDIPVPLTFLFCLEQEQPDPWHFIREMGVDLGRVLHGEQEFVYDAQSFAGDRLTYRVGIQDIYDKRGGALEFITKTTEVTNQEHLRIADLRTVLVVRNQVAA